MSQIILTLSTPDGTWQETFTLGTPDDALAAAQAVVNILSMAPYGGDNPGGDEVVAFEWRKFAVTPADEHVRYAGNDANRGAGEPKQQAEGA